MAYEDMMIHQCDVYHLKTVVKDGEFGLPGEEKMGYATEPDLTSIPCYFYKKSQVIVQMDPHQLINQRLNVQFLNNTSVKHNDKLVFNGVSYRLENPYSVRGHHLEAEVERMNEPMG